MTDNLSGTAAEEPAGDPTANSNFAVLAAIADLGDSATPAAIAQQVGIAYSTVNPKLRSWEAAGLAERFRADTGQTLWRLTDSGRASTATPPQFAPIAAPAAADTIADQAADTACPPSAAMRPSAATATEPRDAGDGRTTTNALPSVAAGGDASVPQPTTADSPLGGDVSSDEESADSADTAVSGTCPPGTVAEPTTPAVDEAAEPDERRDAGTGATTAVTATAKRRRPKGALQASALACLQANPHGEYTVDEVKKKIDQADAGTGYPRASSGAVSNALDKLESDAAIQRIYDRKVVTFRLTPAAD